MVRFTWVLAALACAILGALPILASCEADDPPGPTTDDQSDPTCLGEKADDPSCQSAPLVLSGNDAVSSDTEGSQPDTAPPEPQEPAVDYEGTPCPNKGCVLTASIDDEPDEWDCGEPPDFPPDSFVITGIPTAWVPAKCGLPEPTPE